MLFFPLPFLTAFFLIFMLLYLSRYVMRGLPPVVLVTITAYAVQSVLLGLQWGFGNIPFVVIVSLASIIPPLTWLAFNELAGRATRRTRLWCFVIALGFVGSLNAALITGQGYALDLLAIANYLVFGAHLLWLSIREEFEWQASLPLDSVLPMRRALFIAGVLLLVSASVDVMILVDIQFNDRQISSALVGYSNLTLFILLGLAFFRPGGSRRSAPALGMPSQMPMKSERNDGEPSAEEILERLDAEMAEKRLYRSESLTLDQIARRIRMPSRQVSIAVNSLRAMNVPQYVNGFRIQDACRILEETDMPVTEIVFEVGFTTKSNFNREFQRVTGLTPSAWRTRARRTVVTSPQNSDSGLHIEKPDFRSDQLA